MTPQHPQDSRNTAGICPCCPREEPCRRQHVVHCRDTSEKDSVRPGMTRGTSLRRRPYMKPLSSLLEQAPPSLVLDLMDQVDPGQMFFSDPVHPAAFQLHQILPGHLPPVDLPVLYAL